MDAYPKTLRDVPDDDLADLIAERECLEQCTGLERELIVRWLAARDMIEWLQAEQQLRASQQVAGLGRDWSALRSGPRRGDQRQRGGCATNSGHSASGLVDNRAALTR